MLLHGINKVLKGTVWQFKGSFWEQLVHFQNTQKKQNERKIMSKFGNKFVTKGPKYIFERANRKPEGTDVFIQQS